MLNWNEEIIPAALQPRLQPVTEFAPVQSAAAVVTHEIRLIDLKKERNFFETPVIEYQTGGALSWD